MNSQGMDDIVSFDKQLLQQEGARLPSDSEDWIEYHAPKAPTTMQFTSAFKSLAIRNTNV
jgi:hypothetical protein